MPVEQQRHTDPRVIKTKKRLRQAYIASLSGDEKQLSVAHITALAGVTRGTFYQHYADKAEFFAAVLVDTAADFMHHCVLTDEANVTPHMNLQAALAYARNAQNGFAVLFQNDGDAFIKALHTELTRALVAYANTNAEQYTGILQLADIIDLAAMLDVAIIRRWSLAENDWTAEYVQLLIQQLNTFAPELHLHLQSFYR